MTTKSSKRLGALYGALVGDACGVPYEFRDPNELPPREQLNMIPPDGWIKTYPNVPYGTWSDDGSLLLCLLEAALETPPAQHQWVRPFVGKMQAWRHNGYLAVDGRKFDIGIQTASALTELEDGSNPLDRTDPASANGNGGLMRVMGITLCLLEEQDPAACWLFGSVQSIPTHAHPISRAACGIYSVIAWYLYRGFDIDIAIERTFLWVKQHVSGEEMLTAISVVEKGQHQELRGSGYVVDSLWTALASVWSTTNYRDAIQRAISFGNDTDTTACIAGGLAGMMYGVESIPAEWLDKLRGQEIVLPYVKQLEELYAKA